MAQRRRGNGHSVADDSKLIQATIEVVNPVKDSVIEEFYTELFTMRPDLRGLFPSDMTKQRERLLRAVIALTNLYGDWDKLVPALASMGRAHARFGSQVSFNEWRDVRDALAATIAKYLAANNFAGLRQIGAIVGREVAAAEVLAAWGRAYQYAAGCMMAAAASTGTDADHESTIASVR